MAFRVWCVVCTMLATATAARAQDSWRWPDRAASVRIDTKVKFLDDYHKNEVLNSPAPFQEALETAGFYNRPANQGRYPMHSEPPPAAPSLHKQNSPLFDNPLHKHLTIQEDEYRQEQDGTLDSFQSCKCSSNPHCLHVGPEKVCGEGKFLCCSKKSNNLGQSKTEFFNEEEDERPELLQAGGPRRAGPFPPPPHDAPASGSAQRGVLVGPGGPTGFIGPRGYNPRRIQLSDVRGDRDIALTCRCTTNSSCDFEQLNNICGTKYFCCPRPTKRAPARLGLFPVAPDFDDTPLDVAPTPLLLSPAQPAGHSIIIKPSLKHAPIYSEINFHDHDNNRIGISRTYLTPPVFIGGATGIIEPTRHRLKSVLYRSKGILGPANDGEVHSAMGIIGPGRHVLLAYNNFLNGFD